MFSIGEKIVYPMHGAGFIENIENRTVGGAQADYYAIHIYSGNIKLSLPTQSKAEVTLRKISDRSAAENVLLFLEQAPLPQDTPWNKRYKENMALLKKGDLQSVATVVKSLMLRDHTHGLSTGDRKMLILSRNILFSELCLILEINEATLAEMVSQKIQAITQGEAL